jgi:scyllo-inositol 2-dehydrogenase (NADP+)
MGKMKLGIAGFGRIVELVHIPMIRGFEQLEIAGVFDITPSRKEMASKRNLNTFETYDDLLRSDADLVLIATPPDSHFSLASRALEAGKNVLLEKPATLNLEEAEALLEKSKKHGRFVSVYHNRRYDPDYKLVKKMVSGKSLGRISFIERRHHVFGAAVWFGVKAFDPYWRVKPESGGGALMDWGVHLIDQFCDLGLGDPVNVRSVVCTLPGAEGVTEDYAQLFLELESGLLYSIDINFRSDAAAPLWIIGGEKQTLCIQSDKEAYLMEKGKIVEQLEMEKAGRKAGSEIYAGCIARFEGTGELAVSIEDAIRGFAILKKVRTRG